MLRITQIEEIEGFLLLLPDLVRQQERRSTGFTPNAAAWLSSLEKVFVANRLYQAGNIATLRSGLVAAEQGQVPPGLQFRGRPNRTRVTFAVAWQALQRAAEIASTLVAESRPRLAEAERVAQQIVSAALSRGVITAREEGVNHTQYLQILRSSLVASGDLENAIIHLEGLVGPHDALILLDRSLIPTST
jgi:hypothetical protein